MSVNPKKKKETSRTRSRLSLTFCRRMESLSSINLKIRSLACSTTKKCNLYQKKTITHISGVSRSEIWEDIKFDTSMLKERNTLNITSQIQKIDVEVLCVSGRRNKHIQFLIQEFFCLCSFFFFVFVFPNVIIIKLSAYQER